MEPWPDLDDPFYPFLVADRFYREHPDNGWDDDARTEQQGMTPRAILRMAFDFTACALVAAVPFYVFVEIGR